MLSWLPQNISSFGGDIDSIFYLIYYIVSFWFIVTYGAVIYFVIRYRRRANPRAIYVHGNTFRQYAWILVLGLIILLLDISIDIRGEEVWHKIKLAAPAADVQVRVTAKQFNWEVLYPGPDGKFDTEDDHQIDGQLHVPVDKAVHVDLTSKDVIHSFFLPHLRLKQDALPGRHIRIWFKATKAGKYIWPCAELCGTGHTGMVGHLTVHTPESYEAWVKAQWPAS